MKKFVVLAVLFFISINVCAESVMKKTGFYGVYVKDMPFWTFWNYGKALKAIAEKTHETVEGVQAAIDLKIPVLFTWDHKEAEQLKNELQTFNCDLEVREMAFVPQKEKDGKSSDLEVAAQLYDMSKKFDKALPKDAKPDLEQARQAAIEVLEEEVANESEEKEK